MQLAYLIAASNLVVSLLAASRISILRSKSDTSLCLRKDVPDEQVNHNLRCFLVHVERVNIGLIPVVSHECMTLLIRLLSPAATATV